MADAAMDAIPRELWHEIFRLAASSAAMEIPRRGRPSLRGKPDMTKLSIVLVSRAWYHLGLEPMYDTLVLTRRVAAIEGSADQACYLTPGGRTIASLFRAGSERAGWVRNIYVRGPGRSFPTLIDNASADIAAIITSCACLKFIALYYHSLPPSSVRVLLAAVSALSQKAYSLQRVYVDARPHIDDIVSLLRQCPNLTEFSISESVGEASEASKIFLPRLTTLALGTVDVWELDEIQDNHFHILAQADLPSLQHLDLDIQGGQLPALLPFFDAHATRIRVLDFALSRLATAVEKGISHTSIDECISRFSCLQELRVSYGQFYAERSFLLTGALFNFLHTVHLTNINGHRYAVSCENPYTRTVHGERSFESHLISSYETLAGYDSFLAALCGLRFPALKTIRIDTPVLMSTTTRQRGEDMQPVLAEDGSDEWWNQWVGVLEQEGIQVVSAPHITAR